MCKSLRFLTDTDRCAENFGGILPNTWGSRLPLVAAGLLACYIPLATSPVAAQSYTRAQAGLTGVELSSSSVGDVNEDGHLDLFIMGRDAQGNKTATLYLGNGEGGFTEAEAGIRGVMQGDSAFGDVDGDGHLDLLVTGEDARGFPSSTLYLGDGDGGFTRADAGLVGVQASSCSLGDVNGDGTLDILLVGQNAKRKKVANLYLGTGEGGFTEANAGLIGVYNGSSSVGDVNGDGHPDILITGATGLIHRVSRLYLGDGKGGFTEADAGLTGVFYSSSAVGDMNQDGHLDLLLAGDIARGTVDVNPTTTLYMGKGDGRFASANAGLLDVDLASTSMGDIDGDGNLDVVIAGRNTPGKEYGDPGKNATAVFLGNELGAFTEVERTLPGVSSGASSLGDVDGDGDLDLVLTGQKNNGDPMASLYLWGDSGTPEEPQAKKTTDDDPKIDPSVHKTVMEGYWIWINRRTRYVYFRDPSNHRVNRATYNYADQSWVWKHQDFDASAIDLSVLFKSGFEATESGGKSDLSTESTGECVSSINSAKENKLITLIRQYRKSAGLPRIPISRSLTKVAKIHARDLAKHKPYKKEGCNLHSWSDEGLWRPCCYTPDHQNRFCMTDKPRVITKYGGEGYEIAAARVSSPQEALSGWQSSPGHNAALVGRRTIDKKKVSWEAMGVGMFDGHATVWFGLKPDPAGSPPGCGASGDANTKADSVSVLRDEDERRKQLMGAAGEPVGSPEPIATLSGLQPGFKGPERVSRFGISVAGTGDLNGDGVPEVAVGSSTENAAGFSGAGMVHVFTGSDADSIRKLSSPEPQEDGSFGHALAIPGDVDGDGIRDLLIGAYNETPDSAKDEEPAGRAHLVSGADGSTLQSFTSTSPMANGWFGIAVAGAGDVTGDGVPDLLVGAGQEEASKNGWPVEQAGRAHLYSGRDGHLIRTLSAPSPVPRARFGTAMAGIGDVNGDGTPDQLVGAYRTSSNSKVAAGKAYVFSGADGSVLHVLGPETPKTSDRFGRSVAGIGDVNGDGRPDFAVGASGEDVEDKIAAGRVYVFDGTTGEKLWAVASPLAEGASGRGGAFGRSVAAVGDVDGDGVPDLAVGAPGENSQKSPDAGRAYLVSGADGSLLQAYHSPSPTKSGKFGVAVDGIGDVTGDGIPDLIVGASKEVAEANKEAGAVSGSGQAYLFPGGAYQLSWPLE